MMKTRRKGFTLIELLTVVAIISVLVALALPSFRDALRKSRRSDAMNIITDVHLAQQRWRANDTNYGTLTELGFANPQLSPDGHYSVALSSVSATSYTITATAQSDQASDACGNFILTNNAGVISKTTSSGIADQCWRK